MSVYVDTLAEFIASERDDNDGTRADFELALDIVFGRMIPDLPVGESVPVADDTPAPGLDEDHRDLRDEHWD